MSIELEAKIASLEAELEMERGKNHQRDIDFLADMDDLACEYGCEHLSEDDCFKDILADFVACRVKIKELEQPQIHHVKPISAERIGELVDEVVRGEG